MTLRKIIYDGIIFGKQIAAYPVTDGFAIDPLKEVRKYHNGNHNTYQKCFLPPVYYEFVCYLNLHSLTIITAAT